LLGASSVAVMRAVAVADLHIDSALFGRLNPQTGRHESWEHNARVLHEAIYAGVDYEVEALLLPGDLFVNGWPKIEVQEMVADEIRFATDMGMQVVIIPGNHEYLGLDAQHRHALNRYQDIPGVQVVSSPQVVRLSSGYQVACFPWPRRTEYASRAGTHEPDQLNEIIGKLIQEDFEKLALEYDDSDPGLMVAHVAVDSVPVGSARRGSEMDMVITQTEVSIPTGLLEAGPWGPIILGHIHARQQVGGRSHYTGSPNRHTWSEEGQFKAASLIQDDGTIVDVPLHARELVSIHLPQDQHKMDQLGSEVWVRVYYDTREVAPGDIQKNVEAHISQTIPQHPEQAEASDIVLPDMDTRSAVSGWIRQQPRIDDKTHDQAMEVFDTLVAKAQSVSNE